MESREVKYVTMMGSAAHNYGNVLAMFQNWMLDMIPDGLFKTIHVQSKLAHRQLRSTPHEFLKKLKPAIVFNPRISYDEERFLDGTLLTERHTELYNRGEYAELQPFFYDEKNRIEIKYVLNRYVMNVDVIMVFGTQIQKHNIAHYLKNALRIKTPFDIFANLESFLSKDMMSILSKLCGIPMKDENGSTKPFLDYLNSNSCYPITYKLQGSTGTDEYYRYYPADIIANITDFSPDGNDDRQGHIVTSSQLNMTVRLEWFGTGFYYLFSDEIHDIPKPTIPNDTNLIPIFTDVILEEDLNLPPGWKLYNHTTCMLEKERDNVNVSSLLNNSIREVINFHLENGYPIGEAIDIKVRRQGKLLIPERDFKVDFKNLIVYFNNKSFGFYTYTIMISIDVLYINNLIKKIFNLQ